MKKTTLTKNKEGYGYLYQSPTYHSWNNMKNRCNNKNDKQYKNYGGRGIKYCEKWETFDGFVEDMGVRPQNKTLERINVDGNYEKNNCRWATRLEQQHNLRTHKREDVGVTYDKTHKTCKWQAGIYFKNKKYGNRFKTKEEAINWRKEKEAELWGM